jgi:protein-tyrosine phosphatase
MNLLKKLFSSSEEVPLSKVTIEVDMHSHILHALDDGSQSIEESILLIEELQKLGYKKLIATPHIMGDFFKNSPETIFPKLVELKQKCVDLNISIELEAAAEYYLDEWFMERLNKNEKLLTFGENYLLFELSYINPSAYLAEALFLMKSQGYQPVLVHPERYIFWHGNLEVMKEMVNNGVLLQVNINSLTGYYNKGAKKMAEALIDHNLVRMLGSDCHGIRHIDAMKIARKSAHYKKVLNSILNNTL